MNNCNTSNNDNQQCLVEESSLCNIDGESYTTQLRHLLPRGRAWNPCNWNSSRLYQYWRSFGEILSSMNNRICDYLNEIFPCTAIEAIDDWERVVGVPDDCFPVLTNLEARQQRVCTLLGAQNGNDCQFMTALAASVGWDVECQDLSKQPLAQAGCMIIGCDQLPPYPSSRGPGIDLGYIFIGDCGNMGGTLGCPPEDECCIITGCQALPDNDNETQDYSHCVNPIRQPIPPTGPLIIGCQNGEIPAYRPYAHHWKICLKFGEGNTTLSADCSNIFTIGSSQTGKSLGDYTSTEFIPIDEDSYIIGCSCAGEILGCPTYILEHDSNEMLVTGCSDTGCASICSPSWQDVFCLLERYKPAHTVLHYGFC